jgi:hypothetical protein
MTLPVLVQHSAGQFLASLAGVPEVNGSGASRAEALEALRNEVAAKISAGELVDLEVQPAGVSGLAGRFANDPALRTICDDIYRERDAEQLP